MALTILKRVCESKSSYSADNVEIGDDEGDGNGNGGGHDDDDFDFDNNGGGGGDGDDTDENGDEHTDESFKPIEVCDSN